MANELSASMNTSTYQQPPVTIHSRPKKLFRTAGQGNGGAEADLSAPPLLKATSETQRLDSTGKRSGGGYRE
ncbi:hypothetical protein A2U01_0074391, partial [Trifolium medium]|nr:hypothetical protein [Trifolium medium]